MSGTAAVFQTIIYEKEDGIGYVTLNRPRFLNTYNIEMRDELFVVLSAMRDDPEVMVGIFSGAGEKAFCAGADLKEFLTAPSPVVARQVRWQRDVWGLFLSLPQPLIAALHGYVLGSGIEIALCCDLRIASEEARFGLPEGSLGILAGAGGTQGLPRNIGKAAALEMLLTGRWLDTEEARLAGLVNQVVPGGQHLTTAQELAQRVLHHSPLAIRYAKEAIRVGSEMSLAQGLELEKRLATALLSMVSPVGGG